MSTQRIVLILSLLLSCSLIVLRAQQVEVPGSRLQLLSPNQALTCIFYQKQDSKGLKTLYYELSFKGKKVILPSALDIQLDNHLSEKAMALKVDTHQRWCENLKITKTTQWVKDTTWKPVHGERSMIRDRYNAARIELVKEDNPMYTMHLEFRLYNEGLAFRYFFPENPKGTYYRVKTENTEFNLPESTYAYFANWAQGPYSRLPLKDWSGESERPLTLELNNGLYACLAEAQMVDYSRTKFKLNPQKNNGILTSMHDPADLISPVATPWRVVMVAEKPGELIEHNDIILNLNEPNKIKNTTWLKPGKIIREMTLTTTGAKAAIDFAAAQGLQYILFDWKWYGPAFSFESDATKVVVDLDMPGVIKYGKEKGIGIWLYVNQQALLAQRDSLFRVLHQWGIKGVKFGFVQVGSHRWTTWLQETIRMAAANQIMVNIHDDYRPTGEQRTYPNLITAEGIRGNEEMPDATHNTILPFTRYISGTADYTVCYFDKRIKTTHAHQLALAAIYYSPLQTLYWYDQPKAYQGEPELEFWTHIPTVWDETRVLFGKPGEQVAIARRSGEEWFVGIITNNEGRNLELNLDFLSKGKTYEARIYEDDPKLNTRTQVGIEKRKVNAGSDLKFKLLPSGGAAIWLKPL